MNNPRPNTVTPAELLQWREMKILELSPKFQRRSVWGLLQKSYLIDTILRSMPVPPIYFRNSFVSGAKRLMREVIDGQQRIRAVLDFIDDGFALSQMLEAEPGKKASYVGKKFSGLTEKQQEAILTFTFTYQAFEGITDVEVYEVFRRMNTYSIALNRQELRHGRWFGHFSRSCEALATEHLEFWRENKIVTEENIARMREVELTASLLATQIEGFRDKDEGIVSLYPKFDKRFPGRATHEKRFRAIIDQIIEIFGDDLVNSQFRKPAFFFTLFCTVYHRVFGIPNFKLRTPKKAMRDADRNALAAGASRLSEVLALARESVAALGTRQAPSATPLPGAPYPPELHRFVVASLSGTNGALARETRVETLYTETFG